MVRQTIQCSKRHDRNFVVDPEMDMSWVLGSIHGLGWVGLDRLNLLAASKVEAIEMVRWGLRAGLL